MLQMLPPLPNCEGVHGLRAGSLMRYLAHMKLVPISMLVLTLTLPPYAEAQTGASARAHGAGAGSSQHIQGLEGGSLMQAGALMSASKPVAANDLRSVLQLQKEKEKEKALQLDAAPSERHLSSQQRSELRQQLRQQRESASASN
jgi:hypothetical protein